MLPATAWAGPLELLKPGRPLRVAGECEFPPKLGMLPVALQIEFDDVH